MQLPIRNSNMRLILNLTMLAFLMLLAPVVAIAEDTMLENFEFQPEARWRFLTDGVMGGVSTLTLLLSVRKAMPMRA